MRCPSCNKFPAFEIQEPELDSLECVNGIVTGSCRFVLTTQCCGEEAKEASFDVDLDLTDNIIDALKVAGVENPDLEAEGIEYDVESEDAAGDDRYESTNKKGKPIPSRYQKHFYTLEVKASVTVKYPVPDSEPITVTVDGTWNDEVQASGMEELA